MIHPQEYITDFTKGQLAPQKSTGDTNVHLHIANGQPIDKRWWNDNYKNISNALARGARR